VLKSELDFVLKTGTPAEVETRTALLRLIEKYPLNDWLFTLRVEIEEQSRPHSHPVLTLNTGQRDNELVLLCTFIHEQLHWFEEAHTADRDLAIEETKRYYSDVPTNPPQGSLDELSTRLHLLVCYLEFQIMQRLVGTETAREVMLTLARDHYSWIYRTVLDDDGHISEIMRKYNLLPKGLC
jgi:hypothetical protein